MSNSAEIIGNIGEALGKGAESGDLPLLPESLGEALSEDAEDIASSAEDFGNSVFEDLKDRAGYEGSEFTDGLDEEIKEVNEEIHDEKERFQNSITGEVVYHRDEWTDDEMSDEKKEWLNNHLDGDVNDETKEWMNENGYENLAEDFTEEEQQEAEDLRILVIKNTENDPDALKVIKELMDGEGDLIEESSEAAKLLLRIAVKLGTKLAVSIAKNISKDKEVPQEIRLMAGVLADGLSDAGKFADKLIAGDANADLTKDILAFISDKNN